MWICRGFIVWRSTSGSADDGGPGFTRIRYGYGNDWHSRESGNPESLDPRLRGGDDVVMKIFFILNPSLRAKEWDYREQAAQVARRYGWTPRFGEVDRKNPNSMDQLLRQAWEEDCVRVGVWGGDGTLHRVVNVLQKQKRLKAMEVAPLPAGTCNDFARLLGYHRKHLDEALKRACTGKAEEVDLGLMDSEIFLNNAGIGRRP